MEPPAPATVAVSGAGWRRAAMRHDVRRMSKQGLRELAYDLLAVGAISLPDRRLLSFDPVTCAPHWPDWNTFETPGEADGRRNWIDEVEARIRKGHSEHAYIGYLQSLLSFLKRVETARQELARAAQPATGAKHLSPPVGVAARTPPTTLTSLLPRPAST